MQRFICALNYKSADYKDAYAHCFFSLTYSIKQYVFFSLHISQLAALSANTVMWPI